MGIENKAWQKVRDDQCEVVVDVMLTLNKELGEAGLYEDFDHDNDASSRLLAAATIAYFQPEGASS